jgi:class 3 adenylate cyclase
LKTANLAIVFTDIKGFTERTSRQTLEENERLLKTHDSLLRPLFAAFNGRIVKSIGDAFMVTFESPTQAVLCGVALQDRLWIHNRQAAPGERLEVRVAVNVGEVRVENRDVFGEPVNIAARVEGLADAGDVYFTESVHLSMNKAEVPAEEVGSFELKGIPGKVKVYRVPRAPYRVESPLEVPRYDGEMPPYGNLGLSRVPDPGELRAVQEQIKSAMNTLVDKAKTHRLPSWTRRWKVVAGAAAAAVLLGGVMPLALRPEVARAISSVRGSSGSERTARAQRARELVARVENPGDRAWWSGQLEEALGEPSDATGHYRSAVKAGSSRARDRLVELLGDHACSVRSAAAKALGDLEVTSARGALEDLAEDGGPDDQGGGGFIGKVFGCDSKAAAASALRRLEGT